MRNPLGSKVLIAGVIGAVLGSLGQALINHFAGTSLIANGMMWGAVLGIFIASLSNFTRMGYLTVKSDKPAVNFLVGVGMFCLISLIIIIIFLAIFWVLSRFL
ncbi:MAG: hypothetical protein ACPLRM_04780 [Anaerolineae bacterium]